MGRPYTFIKLTPEQAEEMAVFLREGYLHYGLRIRLRAQTIWFSNEGETVAEISRRLKISQRSIWKWFKIYQTKGLAGLKGKYFYHDK